MSFLVGDSLAKERNGQSKRRLMAWLIFFGIAATMICPLAQGDSQENSQCASDSLNASLDETSQGAAERIATQPVAVNGEFLDPLVQEMQPFLRSQLRFLRRVADFPPEARTKIKEDAEEALRMYAKRLNEHKQGTVKIPEDSQDFFWVKIEESVTTHLSPVLAAQVIHEIDEKRDYEIRAAILCFVATIDEQLALTPEQRGKIVHTLITNWKPEYIHWTDLVYRGGEYLPLLRNESVVTNHLTERQKSVWQSWPKMLMHDRRWRILDGDSLPSDPWWDGEAHPTLLDGLLEK
jgi:hypothetical protein